MENYELVLSPLHSDKIDLAGVEYPDYGYVCCNHFQPNDDLDTGLYGIQWGYSTKYIQQGFSDIFAVVKTEESLISINNVLGMVKFYSGYVVCIGNFRDCLTIIRNDPLLPKFLQTVDLYFVSTDDID